MPCWSSFSHPASQILEARLRARGTDDEPTIKRRLAGARREIELAAGYDVHVINDELDHAVDELAAILSKRLWSEETTMIDELKEEEIVNKVGGRFKLSTLIQKRMIALNQGARALVDVRGVDKMTIVIQEIMQEKIYLDLSGKLRTVEPTEELGDRRRNRRSYPTGRLNRSRPIASRFWSWNPQAPRIAGRSKGGSAPLPTRNGIGFESHWTPVTSALRGGSMSVRQRVLQSAPLIAFALAIVFLGLSLGGYNPADPPGLGRRAAQSTARTIRAARSARLRPHSVHHPGLVVVAAALGLAVVNLLLIAQAVRCPTARTGDWLRARLWSSRPA